ncbi:MAG: lysophospholipid acyltransferase family protein [Gammaproteobacteria bacterium]
MRETVLLLFLKGLSLLPLRAAHGLGALIGWAVWLSPGGPKRVALRNVDLCFPDWSEERRRTLARDSLIETGKTLTEMGAMWFWPREKVLGLLQGIEGEEHFERLRDRGKGIIALTPHLGQWEFLGLVTPRFTPMTSLYRPMRMERLEAPITAGRQRTGNRLVPTNSQGVKDIYAALRRNELAGILPDQDPGKSGGEFAPFFGVQTYTMSFVSRLAERTGLGVVVGYAERLPKGKGFKVHVVPVGEAVNSKDLNVSLAAMNATIEQCIRQCPAQYQWIYKRFKRRPEGEPPIYD